MPDLPHVKIYTDGACRNNPGRGGWGALLRYDQHEKELSGTEKDTTNNRMELTAAVKAFEALKQPCRVDFYTDSQYMRRGITEWLKNWKAKGWKTANNKPVKNQDLWRALERVTKKHEVSWHWVRGHGGHRENERADKLARKAITRIVD